MFLIHQKKVYNYFYSKKCNSQSIIVQFPYGVIQKSYKNRTIFFHRENNSELDHLKKEQFELKAN